MCTVGTTWFCIGESAGRVRERQFEGRQKGRSENRVNGKSLRREFAAPSDRVPVVDAGNR